METLWSVSNGYLQVNSIFVHFNVENIRRLIYVTDSEIRHYM